MIDIFDTWNLFILHCACKLHAYMQPDTLNTLYTFYIVHVHIHVHVHVHVCTCTCIWHSMYMYSTCINVRTRTSSASELQRKDLTFHEHNEIKNIYTVHSNVHVGKLMYMYCARGDNIDLFF